jgi:hypothetical protein
MRLHGLALVAVLLIARSAYASIQLQLVWSPIPNLVGIEHAGDGSNRLFLLDQAGRIRIYDGTTLITTPFLDISGLVPPPATRGTEEGLLGLAFHPNYSSNGFFYVNYTNTSGNIVVARYQASPPSGNVANPGSGTVLLTIPHPTFANHNGGQIRFGPDGYLYIATGDGGSGGDPSDNGQNLNTLLGKILRIDVNGASPYAIPPTNPFVNTAGADEIWSYGLRNPWRFTFDRQTGDMFIADVGQGDWEEIDFEPAATGGRNYGWRRMEGTHCFIPSTNCNTGSLVLPIAEYPHNVEGAFLGCSVTGGFRYRGSTLTAHVGTYFFADYCTGRIWGATPNGDGSWSSVELLDTNRNISTFGEDSAGNLYVGHHGGELYRIVSAGALPRLTISKAGAGKGLVTSSPAGIHCGTICGVEVSGGTVTLSVAPESGWVFAGWSGDTDCVDGSVTLTSSRTCVAHFSASGSFTDETLIPGVTPVKAIHVTELRARIDSQRIRFNLGGFNWSNSPLASGSPVLGLDLQELRTALEQAYKAAGRSPPSPYTDPNLTAGTLIRAVHITELRTFVRQLE